MTTMRALHLVAAPPVPQNLDRIQLREASYCSATPTDVLASTPSTCPTSAQLCPAASASRIASPNAFSTAIDARQHSRTLASGAGAFATRSRRCSPEPLSRRVGVLVPIISTLHPRPLPSMMPRGGSPRRWLPLTVTPAHDVIRFGEDRLAQSRHSAASRPRSTRHVGMRRLLSGRGHEVGTQKRSLSPR